MTQSSVITPAEADVCSQPWVGAVNLLYVCDFPPSNLRGGTVLISRLLKGYPRLRVVTGSYFNDMAPQEGRLDCPHSVFPTSNATGRWGLGMLKVALDWCRIPWLALRLVRMIRRESKQVILTIADGHFFLAAALAGRVAGIPYVLIVHDDWVAVVRRSYHVLKYVARPLFRAVLRGASHVYTVSPAMRQAFRKEYGVDSELQLPAVGPLREGNVYGAEIKESSRFEIVYAGTGTGAVAGALQMLVDVVRSGKLAEQGIDARFTLYTMPPDGEWKHAHGWDHPAISVNGWVSQAELACALRRADALFLPFSFDSVERPWVEQSFPSKTADYVATGRPILVLGPPYSSIVRYARETGCGEVVDTPDPDTLTQAIAHIAQSSARREQLRASSLAAFQQNHDIVLQRARFLATLQQMSVGCKYRY